MMASIQSQVVLSTAIVDIIDSRNSKLQARVVLDSGSQSNFVTEKFAKMLHLNYNNINIPVECLNQVETRIKRSIIAQMQSKNSYFERKLEFLVVPQICNNLPLDFINRKDLEIPRNIKLADPEFHKPEKIDALLGAEIFFELLCIGQIKVANHEALWQKTKLGWVLAGKLGNNEFIRKTRCHLTFDRLQQQMSRFWEIEEIEDKKFLSDEEYKVETHFKENTERDLLGRYTVRLPFNEKKRDLGSSFEVAKRRFIALERKFKQNDTLKQEYIKFMREYEHLGHMTRITNTKFQDNGYFLPHHAVLKETSITTKVRVVFDASAKTNSGISLNDTLMIGPTIQQTLFDILIRGRTHQIILAADIEKMYRMVNMNKDDAKYHRIVWREEQNQELEIFELKTVTYGTASAPYLATRVLHELAENEYQNFPRASEIVKRDFYVDDLFSGANTREEALLLQDELTELLSRGGFNLRQWCSNDSEVMNSIPENLANITLFSDASQPIKTLGIQWNPQMDILTYNVANNFDEPRVTKRIMLSQIAQLFDPIGLLGPVIAKAKIFMQLLWQQKTKWDESVSPEIHTLWMQFRQELNCLNEIKFQR